MKVFEELKKLDPVDMNFKYRSRREVPYQQEICTRDIGKETPEEHEKFIEMYDENAKDTHLTYGM